MTYKKEINIIVESNGAKKEITPSFSRMINAGFSGRDQASVKAHILELAEEGIPGPKTTPIFFSLTCQNLKFGNVIQVNGDKTSGEVEFVIYTHGKKMYIGIGSDHTDRELEQTSMCKAKEICPNIMSEIMWDYDDIKDHWDDLEISSMVRAKMDEDDVLYQKNYLSAILHPNEIKNILKSQLIDPNFDNTIIFSGTIPVLTKSPIYAEYFRCKLHDPILKRTLTCDYEIQKVNNIFTNN